jgi:hypothetical protein
VSVGFLKVLNGGFVKSITVATFTESDINIPNSAIAKMAAQGLVRYSKPLGGFFHREKASHAATLPLMLHTGFATVQRHLTLPDISPAAMRRPSIDVIFFLEGRATERNPPPVPSIIHSARTQPTAVCSRVAVSTPVYRSSLICLLSAAFAPQIAIANPGRPSAAVCGAHKAFYRHFFVTTAEPVAGRSTQASPRQNREYRAGAAAVSASRAAGFRSSICFSLCVQKVWTPKSLDTPFSAKGRRGAAAPSRPSGIWVIPEPESRKSRALGRAPKGFWLLFSAESAPVATAARLLAASRPAGRS